MRIINEHECEILAAQSHKDKRIAVLETVLDTEHGVEYKGWYLVFYGEDGDMAFGIKYCPYCGKLLRRNGE